MIKKCLTLILFVGSFISSAQANKLQLVGRAGMWGYSTKNITASEESESGFGAYNLQLAYGFAEHFSAAVGMNLLMSDGFSGSQGSGLDAGVNYYPFTASTSSTIEEGNVLFSKSETWRPYMGLHLRQRTFNLVLSTTFFGPGVSVGTDYQLGSKWFLNAEARYDLLMGANEAEAVQTNFFLGVGLEF